jgi:hypothetical protein
MDPNLATTNLLLGIMAVVSVLEGLVILGLFAGGVMVYRRVGQAIARVEGTHVAPASARVNAILDDVKAITTIVRLAIEGVDLGARSGLGWLIDRLRGRATDVKDGAT